MKSLWSRRPSPALVVSLIALVVAMGGTSYAALKLPTNSVGASQIKRNAVTGAKVKNQSLTGADIKLSTLGAVPLATRASSAARADSATSAATATQAASATNATNATNAVHAGSADNAANAANAANATNATRAGDADTVSGVAIRGFSYQTPSNGATATLFALGGLTLTASCSAGRVDARTSVDNAYITSSWVTPGDVAVGDADTDFDTTDTFLANVVLAAKAGSIEYVRPGGQRVSVSLQADMAAACTVSGHAFLSG